MRGDEYVLEAAYRCAAQSRDPSSQVGAVALSSHGEVLGRGWNTIPASTGLDIATIDRDQKIACVLHAEVAALLNAHGPTDTLYVTCYACPACATAIVTAGVRRCVGHLPALRATVATGWGAAVHRGLSMLRAAGVECDWLEGKLRAPTIRIGGVDVSPE